MNRIASRPKERRSVGLGKGDERNPAGASVADQQAACRVSVSSASRLRMPNLYGILCDTMPALPRLPMGLRDSPHHGTGNAWSVAATAVAQYRAPLATRTRSSRPATCRSRPRPMSRIQLAELRSEGEAKRQASHRRGKNPQGARRHGERTRAAPPVGHPGAVRRLGRARDERNA